MCSALAADAVQVCSAIFSACPLFADEDECASGGDNCADLCMNTVGSFTCDCNPLTGLKLAADGASCESKHL